MTTYKTKHDLQMEMSVAEWKLGKPLKQSLRAAWEIRKFRNKQRSHYKPDILPLKQRLNNKILDEFIPEIEYRGGETQIAGNNQTSYLELLDKTIDHISRTRIYLLGCKGWRHYSRRFGARKASLAYLCGIDDSGKWAVRVPGTIRYAEEALEKIIPLAVRKAKVNGKQVLRQGDVYAIETQKDSTSTVLPSNHIWDSNTRILTHTANNTKPHKPLHIPFNCKFVVQRSLSMGRTSRHSNAD